MKKGFIIAAVAAAGLLGCDKATEKVDEVTVAARLKLLKANPWELTKLKTTGGTATEATSTEDLLKASGGQIPVVLHVLKDDSVRTIVTVYNSSNNYDPQNDMFKYAIGHGEIGFSLFHKDTALIKPDKNDRTKDVRLAIKSLSTGEFVAELKVGTNTHTLTYKVSTYDATVKILEAATKGWSSGTDDNKIVWKFSKGSEFGETTSTRTVSAPGYYVPIGNKLYMAIYGGDNSSILATVNGTIAATGFEVSYGGTTKTFKPVP